MAYTVINNLLLKLIGLYEFYGTAIIDFDDIRQKHLGRSHDVATRKIKSGGLPFVTFRLADSQKGKLFVHVDDLTELVERQRERARKSSKSISVSLKMPAKGIVNVYKNELASLDSYLEH